MGQRGSTTRGSKSLAPRLDDRLAQLLQPGWARTALARRAVAVLLLGCAVVLLVRGNPGEDPTPVLIAARDLAPGAVLTEADVRLVTRESRTVAEGALTDPSAVAGRTLAAPLRPGEQITDVRVLGSALSASVTGVDEARLVPLRLTDAALTDLIHAGDLVDVIAIEGDGSGIGAAADTSGAGGAGGGSVGAEDAGAVLATAAPVVLVPPPAAKQPARERVILVALPATLATAVATASLTQAITVTLH